MEMKPDEEMKRFAGKFGLTVKRMTVIQKRVYKITAADGKEYCLKQMAHSPARLRWIDATLLRLRKQGLSNIIWRNPNHREGQRLYVKPLPDSAPFVLQPWMKGSWPSPHSKSQMRACGRLLAKFHQAGSRIAIPGSGKNNALGSWTAHLRKEQLRLHRAVLKARRNGFRRPLDGMLQAHGQSLVSMGQASLRSLKTGNYRSLCFKSRAVLCHGDFGPTNILRTSKGMYILDFETLRIDLRAYDLYRLIFNTCHVNGWNFGIVRAILDGYRQIIGLKRSDYRMLGILLQFPRETCKLIANYSTRPRKIKREIERKLPAAISNEFKRAAVLKKLEAYARSRSIAN